MKKNHSISRQTVFEWVCLFFLVALSLLLSYGVLTLGHSWGDDFSLYIMQSRSLLDGTMSQLVQENSFTVFNSSTVFGPPVAGWGFPVLLAPFYGVFGLNIFALKFVNLVFWALFLVTVFALFRRRLAALPGLALVAVLAFNPMFLLFQNNVLTEIPFLFFSTLCLLVLDSTLPASQPLCYPPGKNALLGLILFAAFFIRANGILLLLTVLVCQVGIGWWTVRRSPIQWRSALPGLLTPYLVFIILAALAGFLFPQGFGSEINRWQDLTLRILRDNAIEYFHRGADFYTGMDVPQVWFGLSIPFALLGLFKQARRDYAFIIYGALTVGLYVSYVAPTDERYLFPIFPLYLYFTWTGISNSADLQPVRNLAPAAAYGWTLALVVMSLVSLSGIVRSNQAGDRYAVGPFDPSSTELFRFVSQSLPPDKVVVFRKPRVLRLLTGHNGIMIDRCDQLDRGDFLIIDKTMGTVSQISPDLVSECPMNRKLVQKFENTNFVVYALERE